MDNKYIELEQFLNKGWPSLETFNYDNWLIRFSEGLTKRANSISVYENNKIKIKNKIKYCETFYESKNLPTVFKLLNFNNDVDAVLEHLGYVKKDESLVMEIDLEKNTFDSSKDVLIEYEFKEDWIENFINKVSRSKEFDEVYKKIFKIINGDKICASIEKENDIIAFGYAYVEGEMAGIFDIYVDKYNRKSGYGRKIVEALLYECKKKSQKAYLQVVKDNYVAINLYKDLGFNNLYSYWYRIK